MLRGMKMGNGHIKLVRYLSMVSLLSLTAQASASEQMMGGSDSPVMRRELAVDYLKNGLVAGAHYPKATPTYENLEKILQAPEKVPEELILRGGLDLRAMAPDGSVMKGADKKAIKTKFFYPAPGGSTKKDNPVFPAKLLPAFNGIKKLDVSDNFFEMLPPEIGSITSLETLIASFNNSLVLPEQIGQLKNLKYLDLQGGQLFKRANAPLPESFANLVSLETLFLNRNKLGQAPEVLDRFIEILPRLPNLKELYLHDTRIFREGRIDFMVKLLDQLNNSADGRQITISMFDFSDEKNLKAKDGKLRQLSHALSPALGGDERSFTPDQLTKIRAQVDRWPNLVFVSPWKLPDNDPELRAEATQALGQYIANIQKGSPELASVASQLLLQ